MEKDLIQAKKYLSEQGYGNGTNYTTNLVAVLLANYAASHPPAAPVSGDELTEELQYKIEYIIANTISVRRSDGAMDHVGIAAKRVWDLIMSATLPTREQGAKGCQCKQDYKSVMIAGYTYCQNCGERK